MSDPVQSEALQDRLDRLQELTEFTETCQKQLNELFETLGWSQENDEDFNQVASAFYLQPYKTYLFL